MPGGHSVPRVSVVVAARTPPAAAREALASLAAQRRAADIEVLLADGSDDGRLAALAAVLPHARHLRLPRGNLPALKGAAIREARADIVAVLDPADVADDDWVDELLAAFADPGVSAVGGAVLPPLARNAGNVGAYLFEYGAFNPPLAAGDAPGDLPGNNVAYRRRVLTEDCADLLEAEGFNKPFFHERIRERGGRLVLRPSMRVRHLTEHSFPAFAVSRFHYGRCFGAVRARRAPPSRRLLYRVFAPAVAPILAARHIRRALAHPANRRLLPRAALALCGVCAFWGVGEWLGYWAGPGRSCRELA
jgi:glycosyltransferase involved in cell wall biosynthesis